jgi:long-chain fatty acid transport protein
LRNITVQLLGTVVLSLLVVCIAFGGGYQLNEHGARATGMGGAFVAQASDPSAIFFNPAGLTQLKGINILGGINLIMPSIKFVGSGIIQPVETQAKSQVFTPINLYGTYQIDDQFTVGLGIYNPYGLGTEWPEYWGQALNSSLLGPYKNVFLGSASSVKADIQTWYFNPSVGYKINDEISVGLGISYVYGSVNMSRTIPFIHPSLGVLLGYFGNTMEGTGSAINFNLGVIYKVMPELSIGLSYRTTTNIEFSGDAKFTNKTVAATTYNAAIAPLYPGGTGTATLPMPGSLLVGAAYQIMPELTVEADAQYVQWSAYDKLEINLSPAKTGGQGKITSLKQWDNALMLRGGAEYKLDDQITVRAGLIYDPSPQPLSKTEPMLPDVDRIDITVGGSYKIDQNISVDVSYMLVAGSEKDASKSGLPGKYNMTAHIFSLNVGYAF